MSVAKVLYEIIWTGPGGTPSGRARGNHESVRQLQSALITAGYLPDDIIIQLVPVPEGRHARTRLDEPLYGESAARVGKALRKDRPDPS